MDIPNHLAKHRNRLIDLIEAGKRSGQGSLSAKHICTFCTKVIRINNPSVLADNSHRFDDLAWESIAAVATRYIELALRTITEVEMFLCNITEPSGTFGVGKT